MDPRLSHQQHRHQGEVSPGGQRLAVDRRREEEGGRDVLGSPICPVRRGRHDRRNVGPRIRSPVPRGLDLVLPAGGSGRAVHADRQAGRRRRGRVVVGARCGVVVAGELAGRFGEQGREGTRRDPVPEAIRGGHLGDRRPLHGDDAFRNRSHGAGEDGRAGRGGDERDHRRAAAGWRDGLRARSPRATG